MKLYLKTLATISLLASGSSYGITYMNANADNSSWEFKESRVACNLSQNIPGWGQADFSMKSGGTPILELLLSPLRPFSSKFILEFREEAPDWRPGIRDTGYRMHKVYKNFPGYFKGEDAWYAMSALEKGMTATYIYQDPAYYQRGKVKVQLSPYGFTDAYKNFLNCKSQLLDYGFQDIRKLVIHFRDKNDELTPRSKKELEKLLAYLKEIPEGYSQIVLSAFTDSVGEEPENLKVTDAEIEAVKNVLTKGGVSEDRIVKRSLGENHQAVTNDIETYKKINRRLILEVRTLDYDGPLN